TCDAYGIMPPIARLAPAQAMYHFLSGYTAKVAGTERGVTEPKATFSTCFGAPFLPLNANVYASLLGERIARHGVQCWLVNTGWTGGPYGAGQRMRLSHTRAMVRAALAGKLDRIATRPDPVFGLEAPLQVPGVHEALLLPRRARPRRLPPGSSGASSAGGDARAPARRRRRPLHAAGGVAPRHRALPLLACARGGRAAAPRGPGRTLPRRRRPRYAAGTNRGPVRDAAGADPGPEPCAARGAGVGVARR